MNAFGDYLEGQLADEVRHQLESHIAHCTTCQVVYDSTRKTLQIVTDSASFDLPEVSVNLISGKIMSRIRQKYGP